MNWVSVLREEDLPEGERRLVEVGNHSVLVLRHEGRIYAVASACPHMRLPLRRAKVEGGTIECPWHHSAFDMETGLPVVGARVVPIDVDGSGRAEPEEVFETKEQAVNAVATGRYPSPPARDLNLVTQGKPEGLVRAFVTWVLTDGQDYVAEAGYTTLPAEKLRAELDKLD